MAIICERKYFLITYDHFLAFCCSLRCYRTYAGGGGVLPWHYSDLCIYATNSECEKWSYTFQVSWKLVVSFVNPLNCISKCFLRPLLCISVKFESFIFFSFVLIQDTPKIKLSEMHQNGHNLWKEVFLDNLWSFSGLLLLTEVLQDVCRGGGCSTMTLFRPLHICDK